MTFLGGLFGNNASKPATAGGLFGNTNMSHDTLNSLLEYSNKMITMEVQNRYVSRNELFMMIKYCTLRSIQPDCQAHFIMNSSS